MGTTVQVAGYELSDNPYEGMTIYSPGFLAKQPTLSVGQADDLKVEAGGFRYWLARCGPEDGEEWQVHVERFDDGRWCNLLSYREEQ